jgi:hypothetical protein
MKIHAFHLLGVLILSIVLCLPVSGSQQSTMQTPVFPMLTDGLILYSPMWTTNAFLMDSEGSVQHSWKTSFYPGVAVWWLGDDTILRTIRVGVGPGAGGAGGGVQIIQSDGTITWDYRYNTDGKLSHHDTKVLPNGNVLLIAWETRTKAQAVQAGRNPSHVSNSGLMPDHIIEVQPTGPTSGDIVWEWHVWDHLIQDYDSSKDNYGVVEDHPELVDVNYYYDAMNSVDWMHTNSVDYNPAFDQLMISIHNFGEVWIIDHSTTKDEAAGHTGGQYGHGGDLLYRWGNPAVYGAGTSTDKKLFCQHDATWIKTGLPGAGDILIFNNGADRPGSHYSTVDEITPPVDENGEYYLEPGSAYGPSTFNWEYMASPATSFYANNLGGAQRLANGNTLICNGPSGKYFEVTPEGSTVWQYSTYAEQFKIVYLPAGQEQSREPNLDCSGSLTWTKVKPGATVTGSFTVQNIGDAGSLLNWTVDTSLLTWGNWTLTPTSGIGLTPEAGSCTVQVSVVAPDEPKQTFEGLLKVVNVNNASDFDTVPISLTTPTIYHQDPLLVRLLHALFPQFFERFALGHWRFEGDR